MLLLLLALTVVAAAAARHSYQAATPPRDTTGKDTTANMLLFPGDTLGDEGHEPQKVPRQSRDKEALARALAPGSWWRASMKGHDRRLAWWRQARFGMFVHWGVYAEAGGQWQGKKVGGYAEHLMRKEKISKKDYLTLAESFNPVKFDADSWIKTAKAAGMRYFIITAKHHDGFAMYPSKVSAFNINQATAYKQDPMQALKAACKKYGLKFGFYYSHAFDWEDPDAPGNDWEYKNPGGDLNLYGGTNWYDLHPALLERIRKYVDRKAIPQIKELIDMYHPDILWFDTPHKLPLSENLRILEAIRKVDPDVVVNGRLVRSADQNFGDYQNTADRPAEFFPVSGDWEAIPTTNESYGYSRYDHSHKPASHFIRLLANAASRGGNLLLNIGPMGDGAMAPEDLQILSGISRWMAVNSESIYGTETTPLPMQSWGVSTYKPASLSEKKPARLYLQIFQLPEDGRLYVGGIKTPVKKAYLLSRVSANKILSFVQKGDLVTLQLPEDPDKLDSVSTVIVLELTGRPAFDRVRFIAPNTKATRFLAFDAVLSADRKATNPTDTKSRPAGFSYGDGKKDQYDVSGWTSPLQTVSWDFKVVKAADYKLRLRYLHDQVTEGRYEVLMDGKVLQQLSVQKTQKSTEIQTAVMGNIHIAAGVHEIQLRPVEITGRELMRPLELDLDLN